MSEPVRPAVVTRSSASEQQTRAIGRAVGLCAVPGLVVALVGTPGAGKTRFVQGVADGLGVRDADVNSPTFVLIQEYAGRLPVYHFDTYRLRDSDEFAELGADELLYGEGVCLIEWADRVQGLLPRDRLEVRFEITGETERRLTFEATGPLAEGVLAALQL